MAPVPWALPRFWGTHGYRCGGTGLGLREPRMREPSVTAPSRDVRGRLSSWVRPSLGPLMRVVWTRRLGRSEA